MRILVCGGRDFTNRQTLEIVLWNYLTKVTAIIHGDARGADRMAGVWANTHNIEEIRFPADWNKYGKSAGPIRNEQMLIEGRPDLVIAFPGGVGTADMVNRAKKAGVKVIEI